MVLPSKSELLSSACQAYPQGAPALSEAQVSTLLGYTSQWRSEADKIVREYSFSNYLSGVRWFDVVADISEKEDHHPDVLVSWGRVVVTYWTHTVGGLSLNDFILALKLDEAWRIFEKSGV